MKVSKKEKFVDVKSCASKYLSASAEAELTGDKTVSRVKVVVRFWSYMHRQKGLEVILAWDSCNRGC